MAVNAAAETSLFRSGWRHVTQIVRVATVDEIEALLLDLGGGNHPDNMQALRKFRTFALVDLEELDFFHLVFLQNDEVLSICPRGQDRTLGAVARRATTARNRRLSPNWDIDAIVARAKERLNSLAHRPLVLREARESESQHGSWYIQDGAHSALGHALALLSGDASYSLVRAYCATSRGVL